MARRLPHILLRLLLAMMMFAWLAEAPGNELSRLPPVVGEPILAADLGPGDSDLEPDASTADDDVSQSCWCGELRAWQLMPQGLIYRGYLAGAKESRFQSFWAHEKDQGWIWDVVLGGRVGLLRYGTLGEGRPEGFQIDIEGAGMPRLDLEEDMDVISADFRFGIPITYGNEHYQTKLAYYHLSSHLGDEFLLKNPGYPRLNYSRDVLVWGESIYPTEELRLYGEVGYAMASDVAEPWEMQFGVEYSPAYGTGAGGGPFVALNGHLREEVDFGGNFVAQAGWAWRGSASSGLFRFGAEYFSGKSDQFSFFDESESKVGLGLWYDY